MAHQSKPIRPISSVLLLTLLTSSVTTAQTTTPFVDQATGIQFQRFFGARTNFGFGIALPAAAANSSTSFIGQLAFPLVNGAGWGGWSLTGDMEGPLLMAAWSDGQGNVVSSFRQAFDEDNNPPEVTGSFSLRPIAEATSVNNTFLTYTFLCEGCLGAGLGLDAAAGAATAEMGWALAGRAVRNPTSSAGVLDFHDKGFGDFRADLNAARSARFDEWAALAGTAVGPAAGARQFDLAAGADEGDSGDEDSGDEGGGVDDDSGDDSDDDD
ncbi:putative cellobiose dehydrogenase [Coniochaeta sp. 2T2.1]|nr:putative cellobiose dehydrogenase [Coniochaeta sp. 2T2.1]